MPDTTFVATVIVGAGPAGLAAAACLSRAREPYVVLDAADRVGSSWYGHYDRLHLHTARAYSALPFLPMPADWPTYPSRAQVAAYFTTYADAFGIRPRFGVRVTSARREGDLWTIDTSTGAPGESPAPAGSYRARNLIVATGYNAVPHRPTWPGLEVFAGRVVHSSEYRNGKDLRDLQVLVVGSGNSGAEIAIDLWEHGARPALCIRGPVHVVPRDLFGIPAQRVTIALSSLPTAVADRLSRPLRDALVGDLTRYGIRRPALGPLETLEKYGRVPLIDVGTLALIRQGAIRVLPDIARLDATEITFVDGRHHAFDALVLATGYRAGLERWLADSVKVLDDRGLPRAHGAPTSLPGLYFLGFKNPTTGALREIALEARRIAAAIEAEARHR